MPKANPMKEAAAAVAAAQPKTSSALVSLFRTVFLPLLPSLITQAVGTRKDKPTVKAALIPVRDILNEWYPEEEEE